MNITIYPESFDWLFDMRTLGSRCLWSFGWHRPPVDIGDDLIFRQDGVAKARAICRRIYKPGELNAMMHDGSRQLKGWKTLWYQIDFEDMRNRSVGLSFGRSLSPRQDAALRFLAEIGTRPSGATRATFEQLVQRGLIEPRGNRLTFEGWRVLTRSTSDSRRNDIEDTDDGMGGPCCRLCGCTENHACDDGCSWTGAHTPPLCTKCEYLLLNNGIDLTARG